MVAPQPTLVELSQSVAVMLQNTHAPMNTVKPNVPGIVDVGGLHITSPKPLPKDLRKFLDDPTTAVIYFSFGNTETTNSINFIIAFHPL